MFEPAPVVAARDAASGPSIHDRVVQVLTARPSSAPRSPATGPPQTPARARPRPAVERRAAAGLSSAWTIRPRSPVVRTPSEIRGAPSPRQGQHHDASSLVATSTSLADRSTSPARARSSAVDRRQPLPRLGQGDPRARVRSRPKGSAARRARSAGRRPGAGRRPARAVASPRAHHLPPRGGVAVGERATASSTTCSTASPPPGPRRCHGPGRRPGARPTPGARRRGTGPRPAPGIPARRRGAPARTDSSWARPGTRPDVAASGEHRQVVPEQVARHAGIPAGAGGHPVQPRLLVHPRPRSPPRTSRRLRAGHRQPGVRRSGRARPRDRAAAGGPAPAGWRPLEEAQQLHRERQHQRGVLLGRHLDDGLEQAQLQGRRVLGPSSRPPGPASPTPGAPRRR